MEKRYKLYISRIIKQNNIFFTKEKIINSDREFNFRYLQFIDSFVFFKDCTYNYVENPLSMTRIYVYPEMFINAAIVYDNFLKKSLLYTNMNSHVVKYVMKFFMHAFGLCIVSPIKKLSIKNRFVTLFLIVKSMFYSYAFRKYFALSLKKILSETFLYIIKYFSSYQTIKKNWNSK